VEVALICLHNRLAVSRWRTGCDSNGFAIESEADRLAVCAGLNDRKTISRGEDAISIERLNAEMGFDFCAAEAVRLVPGKSVVPDNTVTRVGPNGAVGGFYDLEDVRAGKAVALGKVHPSPSLLYGCAETRPLL